MKSIFTQNKNIVTDDNQSGGKSFYERLARSGPGMSVVFSGSDKRIVFANDAFIEFTGLTEGKVIGRSFNSFLDSFQQRRFDILVNDLDRNNYMPSSFMIFELADSKGVRRSFYMYIAGVNEGGNDGEKMYHLFLLLDQSKWGMPFTSFESRELFLEQFNVEEFGTFEWMFAAKGVYWSPGVYRIYEVSSEKIGLDADYTTSFIHPHDKERVMKLIADAMKAEGKIDVEYRIISGKNNLKQLHCLAHIINDESGKPLKMVGSLRDITGQRTIELNMKDMVDELHRSNKALEEFAYAASHDLQEPLRKITTFSDRLQEKYKSVLIGDGQMYLSRMVASAENMRLLINALLEFSRISQTSVPFEKVSLDAILQDVMNDLEVKIEETGTAIRCTGLPAVEAVAPQMKQLFQNLISNAIKFHKPDMPPIIRIEVGEISDTELKNFNLQPQKRYHKISVADNGIGFDSEYANRIFQVFQRLHGRSEYPGSGIGLAICKKILEYHHGVIFAENIPGTGARFTFIIPEKH